MEDTMYYKKQNTDLKLELYSKLIVECHPIYSKSPFKEALLERPADFNIEHLVEQAFEYNCEGRYKFNDGIHEDYDDGSDAKTGTLHINGQASKAEISSVKSKDGTLKNGSIRAIVLNPILKKLHFIFVPKDSLYKAMHTKNGKLKVSNSLWIRYNKRKNEFTTLKNYGIIECNSFKELAMEINR
tara:strand:+ start:33 stop:587 length:555 start_codon:yes stop_codon:yes gene_type:complete